MDKKKDNDEESTRFLKLAILPLDSATPPVNGTEWLSSVKSVFAELGFEHFTLTAFNQIFLGVDKESVMHQYLDMLQKQATAKGGELKKEVATAEKDVKKKEGQSDGAEAGDAGKGGGGDARAADVDFSASDLELLTSARETKTYGCPISKGAESRQSRKSRMHADRLIRNSLVHHPHLYTGVDIGNVAEVLRLGKGFALGSEAKLAVAQCKLLFSMTKRPEESMSKFASRIITLEKRMFQPGADPAFQIGRSLFVHAVCAMCDAEPSLVTELALLRKQESRSRPLTLTYVLENLGRSCAQPKKAAAFQGKVQYCHDYNNGKCKRGAVDCRFTHQKDPNWVDHPRNSSGKKTRDRKPQKCGVPGCDMDRSAHSIKDCPVFAAVAAPAATPKDHPAVPDQSSVALPLAHPTGVVAVPSHFVAHDTVYGIDHTISSLTGFG
jgi:hypothetical protein